MPRPAPVVGVTPAVLKWAREGLNLSVNDVATRLKCSAEQIEAWEAGDSAPTYSQLEALAYSIYKRPVALFFMPVPPREPLLRTEFRSLPESDFADISRDTILLIRKAKAYQIALQELYVDRNPNAKLIWDDLRISPEGQIANQAQRVRNALGVTLADVRNQTTVQGALKLWRKAIERNGIFVFKDSFKQREFSGFCLRHNAFPIILINNSTTQTRQIFSLLHELAHILCDRSSISRFDDGDLDGLSPPDRATEQFCNALASEILVPMIDFNSVTLGFNPEGARDEQFAEIAERYWVSRSVIMRRFVDLGRVDIQFYLQKDREWNAQISGPKGRGGSYYNTQGVYLSDQFLREVISRYSRRLITKEEASDFIGVKARNFDRFEDMVMRGVTA